MEFDQSDVSGAYALKACINKNQTVQEPVIIPNEMISGFLCPFFDRSYTSR